MEKRPGLLAKIDAGRASAMIAGMGGRPTQDSIDEILDPGLKQVKRLTDDELAEVIGREPGSKLGRLAESVLRGRESWRTPAKWALIVSLLSFAVAAWALFRTL